MRRRGLLTGVAALTAFSALDGRAALVSPAGVTPQQLAGRMNPATIQGFGDSITAQATYFPTNTDISNVPQWVTATVYPAAFVVKNGGNVFSTVAGGTSGATPPTPSTLNDGGVVWVRILWTAAKFATSYLTWAELYSGGRLVWDMSTGYAGVANGAFRAIVTAGGSGYVAPVASLTGGATASVQSSGGVVTGVTILSPGSNSPGNLTITDSSGPGTGATADLLQSASGTLGISGNSTTQMLHRLSDALACKADIILVHGGTNDVNGGATSVTAAKAVVTAAIANLRTIYESLMLAGKRIIAVPITPATTLATPLKTAATISINRWIRAYCRGEAWANPSGFRQIRLADAGVFTEDGTVQTSFAPIGGSGGTAIAMTQDGLHPSQRGAAYYGYAIWQAAQGFLTTQADKYAGIYSSIDGYNSTVNAGGNMMEGLTWQASTVYAPGDMSANGGNVYYVASVAGNATSAGSGGPVGGGSGIVDGNVTWNYGSAPVGRSNFSGGTTGSQTAATGIVYSGLTASGWAITRLSGTASGTVAFTIENPWSNGQVGVRQAVVFTLGSGGQEQWNFAPATLANDHLGLVSGDLGVTAIYAETEIEVSSVVNCTGIVLILSGDSFSSQIGAQTNGVGEHFINSAGEQIGYPTAGRMLLRTQPMIVPVSNTTITPLIRIFFDASGGAGSATMTLKLNYVAIRRAGVA